MNRILQLLTFLVALSDLHPSLQPQPGGLSGRVVDEQSAPVRLALVTVSSSELAYRLSAVTDETGHFSFDRLPAGRFLVSASKAAHITNYFGSKRIGGPGIRLSVSAGHKSSEITLVLPRGAVISGVVRDLNGEPASGVQVIASPIERTVEARSSVTAAVTSDDRGVYRFFGLFPGEYVVSASSRPVGSRGIARLSSAEIDAQLESLRRRSQIAVAPEKHTQIATYGLAPTFHPSTADMANAARIAVEAGTTREGIDIDLLLVPTVNIHGTVLSLDGSSITGVQLSMVAASQDFSEELVRTLRIVQPDKTGRFSVVSVAPGRYILTAISRRQNTGMSTDSLTWARAELAIHGNDVEDLKLQLKPSLKMAGRLVVTDSDSTEALAMVKKSSVTLREVGVHADGSQVSSGRKATGQIGGDGSFELTGLLPGRYELSISPLATRYRLQSAMWQGRDLLDFGVEIGDMDLTELVVTVSNRLASVRGRLMTPPDVAASDYILVLFPGDRTLWHASRRLHSSRPASDGDYLFEHLPPGQYRVAALTDIDASVWKTPAFMEAVLAQSVSVDLVAGQQRTLDIKVGR